MSLRRFKFVRRLEWSTNRGFVMLFPGGWYNCDLYGFRLHYENCKPCGVFFGVGPLLWSGFFWKR